MHLAICRGNSSTYGNVYDIKELEIRKRTTRASFLISQNVCYEVYMHIELLYVLFVVLHFNKLTNTKWHLEICQ